MKIGKSRGAFYLVVDGFIDGKTGKPYAIPIYGPYETRAEAAEALKEHGDG